MKISEHESEGQPNGWTEGAGERASRGGKKRRNKEAPEERKRNRGEWPDIGTEKEGKREREREQGSRQEEVIRRFGWRANRI